jgi:MoaA/NifB/PqqE/SkfB family radical SAM enzyme
MKIIGIDKKDSKFNFTIQWRPTNMCNYDCSYCSPSNHLPIESNNFPDVHKLIFALDKIKEKLPPDYTVNVVITGGEPFLVPDFNLWLDRFKYHQIRFTIFTNGSLPIKMYQTCIESLKDNYIKISFHPETADLFKIANLAKYLKSHGVNVEVRGMLIPTLFDKVFDLEKELEKEGINLNKLIAFPLVNKHTREINRPFQSSRFLKNVRQTSDLTLDYYSEKEKEVINEIEVVQKEKQLINNSYLTLQLETLENDEIKIVESSVDSIILQDLNKFRGWNCNVSKRKLCVQANGDLQFGVCGNDGVFGNIFLDNEIFLDFQETICNQDFCQVPDEIRITKRIALNKENK